jgi:hypothetical protein
MARVRTVREHLNSYGVAPAKAIGDEYELADNMAAALAGAGLVELVVNDAALAAPADAPPSASAAAVVDAPKPVKAKRGK